jgi:thioredoxin reductase (NADPH)
MADLREVDCLIIGGGPGGLTAATYLGRFRRSTLVIDAGESRLQLIPLARNVPGFPDGAPGKELYERMRTQALRYGADILSGRVTACESDGGAFLARSSVGDVRARTVLVASGVDMKSPEMADLDVAIARGLVRYCPVCDGFEAIGSRIAVLAGRPGSIGEAHFLRTYSNDVTYVPVRSAPTLTDEEAASARRHDITIEPNPCTRLAIRDDAIELELTTGARHAFDIVYPCLGSLPRSAVAQALDAQLSNQAEVMTNSHQATNVEGLYAAGDVVRGLDQIASACGQAAIAATSMHNWLRGKESGDLTG